MDQAYDKSLNLEEIKTLLEKWSELLLKNALDNLHKMFSQLISLYIFSKENLQITDFP